MLECLRASMRLKPTRIVVGEVRGAEAHTLLKAWNTGHPAASGRFTRTEPYSASRDWKAWWRKALTPRSKS